MRRAALRPLGLFLLFLVGATAAPLSAAEPAEAIPLFNGQDLTGWTYELADPNVKPEEVWSVQDGVLICKGTPSGYIRTEKDYADYVLTLEWLWPTGSQGGNSGVLLHTSDPGAIGIWPKSIEAQLAAGDAGDFWVIGTTVEVENAGERVMGRRCVNLTDGSEKPVGEWNRYEITCRGEEVTLKINDVLVNHATACSATRGAICLQSEGAEIHFRNIRLQPLAP